MSVFVQRHLPLVWTLIITYINGTCKCTTFQEGIHESYQRQFYACSIKICWYLYLFKSESSLIKVPSLSLQLHLHSEVSTYFCGGSFSSFQEHLSLPQIKALEGFWGSSVIV